MTTYFSSLGVNCIGLDCRRPELVRIKQDNLGLGWTEVCWARVDWLGLELDWLKLDCLRLDLD